MPKMHHGTFGGWVLPRPAGELIRAPRHPSPIGGPTANGREERGKGLLIRGREEDGGLLIMEMEGWREEREREGIGIPPQSRSVE